MFHMFLSEEEEIVTSVDNSPFSTSTIATRASRTSSISFLKTKCMHLKFTFAFINSFYSGDYVVNKIFSMVYDLTPKVRIIF